MCGIWDIRDKKEMDLDTFNRIFRESKLLRRLSLVTFTGGEPFIKDDLAEFVKVVNKFASPLNITLDTNGFATEKIINTIDKILAESKTPINVKLSVDGIGEIHDEIRGINGGFKMCMNTIDELCRIKKRYPRHLWISLGFTANRRNYDHIDKIIGLARSKGIGFFYKPVMRAQKLANKDMEDVLLLTEPQRDYLVKRHKAIMNGLSGSYFAKRYLYRKYLSFLDKYYLKPYRYITCYALSASFHISSDWKVFSCLQHCWAIGDLKYATFDEVFNGESASLIRQRIKNSRCHCLCTGDIFPSILTNNFPFYL